MEYMTIQDAREFTSRWFKEQYAATGKEPDINVLSWLCVVIAAYNQGRKDEHNDPKH